MYVYNFRYVAGSCGPYGSMLEGGQEFRGEYQVPHEELVAFHGARAATLWESGCDVLAFETLPQLAEVRAALDVLDHHVPPAAVAWVSMQCRDGEHLASGESAAEAFSLASTHPRVVAVGCNCVNQEYVESLLALARRCSNLPLIVCANIGQVWNAQTFQWTGPPIAWDASRLARTWITAGARVIGGCCGAGPEHIRLLAQAVRQMSREQNEVEDEGNR